MNKFVVKILIPVLLIALIVAFFIFRGNKNNQPVTITTHQEIVEKVEAIGKLELVRMNMQDVVEHQIVREWLPNAKAILLVYGEAVGCIDMQKIKPDNIIIQGDTLHIKLPQPELCYCKIDHSKSKIYDTQFNIFSGAELIDGAYREAETQMRNTVLKAGILDQTKVNAVSFFLPFFQTLGFKYTFISFDEVNWKN